jgi:hypothetical protein
VVTKKTVAKAAVERDKKLALPLAPNKLPEAPLPKEAPMSAPLPCWISTRPIIASADSNCTAKIRVIQICMMKKLRESIQKEIQRAFERQRGTQREATVPLGI